MPIPRRSPKPLGRNIKRLRLARNLTQGALGARAGTDKTHISRIEAGKIDPSLSTARAIAKALNASLDELAGIARAATTA